MQSVKPTELSAEACNKQIKTIYKWGLPRDLEKFKQYINNTIEVAELTNNKKELARANYNKGKFFIASGRGYSNAIPPLLKGRSLFEELQDSMGVAICYMQLGLIGYATQYFEDGIKNFNLSLQYVPNYATSLYLMAITYTELGDFDKAKGYFKQAITAYSEKGDSRGISECYMYLGDLYIDEGKYDSAYAFLHKSIRNQKQYNLLDELSRPYALISRYFLELNNLDSAKYYASSALEGSKDEYDNLSSMLAIETLSKVYEREGDFEKAHNYLKKYHKLRSENVQGSTKQKIAEMQSMFDFERKMAAENLTHQEAMRKKNQTKNALLITGLFILLLSIGLWSRLQFVRKSKQRLQGEKDRSDELLLNILPKEVADELKLKGKSEARDFDNVTVLFTDFVAFTQTAETLTAKELVDEINACFEAFDEIITRFNLEKIKTIGDAYMAAGGLHVPQTSEPSDVVLAALDMQAFMLKRKAKRQEKNLPAFEMRVGIHTGPVVAGIVGVKKFQYDILGDTVNTASRMESHGEIDKVNISNDTYERIKYDKDLTFESRGKLDVKGKGEMKMWFVSHRSQST